MSKHLLVFVATILLQRISIQPKAADQKEKKAVENSEPFHWVITVVLPKLSYFLYTLPIYHFFFFSPVVHYIDIIAFVATISSCAFRLWSYSVLNEFFTFQVSTSANHKLITHGPYKFVRHPGYTGLLLAGTSYAVFWINNPFFSVSLSVALLLLPVLFTWTWILNRLKMEEEFLKKIFGKEYIEFQRSRARLIPGIY